MHCLYGSQSVVSIVPVRRVMRSLQGYNCLLHPTGHGSLLYVSSVGVGLGDIANQRDNLLDQPQIAETFGLDDSLHKLKDLNEELVEYSQVLAILG